MNKIVVLVLGFFMSLSASAVKVHEVLTENERPLMYNGLLRASEEAAQELQRMPFKPEDFVQNYVERLKKGTISRWVLRHKDYGPLDEFYARNGKDVRREYASRRTFSGAGSAGKKISEERLVFARRKAPFEHTIPEAITGADVTSDVKRFSDAEIKAIQRGFRTKQRLNFNAEDLILEGYVDKPNCPVCSMNLEHFEGVGPGKLAKEIRIMHLSKELHDSSFRDRRQNVVDEITSCE